MFTYYDIDPEATPRDGAAYRIHNLAKYISALGPKVFVVIGRRPRLGKYYVYEGGSVRLATVPSTARVFFTVLASIFRVVRYLCLALRITPLIFEYMALSWDLGTLFFLSYVTRRERIHLLQAEGLASAGPTILTAKLTGRKVVVDDHNVEHIVLSHLGGSRAEVRFLRSFEHLCLGNADLILTVSADDRQEVVRLGVGGTKIKVVPNAVDLSKFSNIATSVLRATLHGDPIIIFHGSMHYEPNVEAVIRIRDFIRPNVAKNWPSVEFLVLGPGSERFNGDGLTCLGFVRNLEDFIAAADLAVVPLTKGGGTKTKILEYMAAGKAIVSTRKGVEGLDLVDGEEVIVRNYPDGKFVQAIEVLLSDTNLRRRLGESARRKANTSYGWESNAKVLNEAYRSLLHRSMERGAVS